MYDTLSYTEKLEETGIERKQAEAIVKNQFEAIKENVATKADLKVTASSLRFEIEKFRSEIKIIEKNMTIKLWKMIFASVAMTVTLQSFILTYVFKIFIGES